MGQPNSRTVRIRLFAIGDQNCLLCEWTYVRRTIPVRMTLENRSTRDLSAGRTQLLWLFPYGFSLSHRYHTLYLQTGIRSTLLILSVVFSRSELTSISV